MADAATDATASAFARFLARSLETLAMESPVHLAVLQRAMRGLSVRITIGQDAPIRVQLDARPWVGPVAHAEVTVVIAEDDVIELLEGGLGIEQAIDDERLMLQGALADLLAFFDALAAWVHGAVRCPSFPSLYRDYVALKGIPCSTSPIASASTTVHSGPTTAGRRPSRGSPTRTAATRRS